MLGREVSPLVVDPAADPGAADLTPWLDRRLHEFVDGRAERLGFPVFLHKLTGRPCAGLLSAAFPEARFVHVVRDGTRAVASSWLQMPWWKGHLGPEGWHFSGRCPDELDELRQQKSRSQPVLAGLAWRMLVDAYDRAADELGDRWLTVRYEDVLADPQGELTRVLEHFGLTWTDEFAAGVGRYDLLAERTEAFRDDLGPRHVADLDDVLGEHLLRHGYQVAPRDERGRRTPGGRHPGRVPGCRPRASRVFVAGWRAGSAGLGDHAGGHGAVGRLVDEHEATGVAVAGVVVGHERHRRAQAHTPDLVEREAVRLLVTVQRVDVEPVLQRLDDGARGAGGGLMTYSPPSRIGEASSIQQTMASMSWATFGRSCGRQIMSPRDTSISSSRRTVTDMGGKASSTSPSAVSTERIRLVKPEGSTITSSPFLRMPPITWPA